jgi:TolA-binding protein
MEVVMQGKRGLLVRFVPIVISFLLCFAGATISLAAHHEEEKTSASDVKEEAVETYQVLKEYTLEQRDEAIDAAEEKIARLDTRIAEMQQLIDEKWQSMSKDARIQTRNSIDALNQKRQDLAEWLGGLRYSSRQAWEDVKKGFADSYDRLERAFAEANQDFEKNRDEKTQ